MNKASKITILVIVVVIAAGVGVYFWQKPQMQVSKSDEKIVSDESVEIVDETASWKKYSSPMGVSIKYPNDGSYSVEVSDSNHISVTQEHPGNRFNISRSDSAPMLLDNPDVKVINNETYKVFHRVGMGGGYGYVMEHGGEFYVFESVYGPENEIFELMMTTVEIN